MKTRFTAILIGFLLAGLSLTLNAGSPVWKLEKNGHHFYLGGTIHVLASSDYPLPASFDKAYQQAQKLVLETDMQKIQSPGFQQELVKQLTYSDGQNLQTILTRSTYQEIEAFFGARGIPMASMINFKPGMIVTMMTMLELQRLGIDGIGVDAFYSAKALEDRKKLGELEPVETQIAFLANMGVGREDEILNFSLNDVEQLPTLMAAMKRAWRQGDMKQLEKLGITDLKKDFPRVYQELLVDRNNAWMPQIEAMAQTDEVELVLVGALHLAGNDGLLAQLKARGYKASMM